MRRPMDDPKALIPGPALNPSTIDRYADLVPDAVLALWREHGLATTANGFVRFVDPTSLVDLVAATTARFGGAVPLFTTAFGDVGVLTNGSVAVVKYRHGRASILTTRPEWLVRIIGTSTGREDARHLDWRPYPEAVERLGIPATDECLGYAPLLALGGSETAEALEIVALREHILLITQFAGPVP
jgi:hypothetical protein